MPVVLQNFSTFLDHISLWKFLFQMSNQHYDEVRDILQESKVLRFGRKVDKRDHLDMAKLARLFRLRYVELSVAAKSSQSSSTTNEATTSFTSLSPFLMTRFVTTFPNMFDQFPTYLKKVLPLLEVSVASWTIATQLMVMLDG